MVMTPKTVVAVFATSLLLVTWGTPVASEAGLNVKFKSGNFKASYRSGGYGGFYGGKGRGFYGGKWGHRGHRHGGFYPRRYYPYYAPYAYFGPSVYSVSYGYPEPVSYLPPQYAPQPQQQTTSTTRETVSNSPGAIIINSENTVIYNNAPGATPLETNQEKTTTMSLAPAESQVSQVSQPLRYQYATPRRYGY